MKPCKILILGIICLLQSVTAFAGSNHVDSFNGILKSVSVIDENGHEYLLPSSSGTFTLGNKIDIHAEAGDGKDLPYGKYIKVKYVFENNFKASGHITLDDGSVYNSKATSNTAPEFVKNGALEEFTYQYPNGSNDYGWAIVNVNGSELSTTENNDFELTEKNGKTLNLQFTIRWLWFGPNGPSWDHFDETQYIKPTPPTGSDEWFYLQGNTLKAPYIDPPELYN